MADSELTKKVRKDASNYADHATGLGVEGIERVTRYAHDIDLLGVYQRCTELSAALDEERAERVRLEAIVLAFVKSYASAAGLEPETAMSMQLAESLLRIK